MQVLTEQEKTKMISAIMSAFDRIVIELQFGRPQLFIQYPCAGTHAVVYLKDILHPSDTVKCMDIIHEKLILAGFAGCIVAAGLSELEINL